MVRLKVKHDTTSAVPNSRFPCPIPFPPSCIRFLVGSMSFLVSVHVQISRLELARGSFFEITVAVDELNMNKLPITGFETSVLCERRG